jgi:cytochrome c-type biogenesis protein CcmH/NrfF
MRRRSVFAFPWLAAAWLARPLCANPANGDPRKEKLFSMFIAPCCWRQNLLAHASPEAKQLRAEITQWIDEGRSDGAIKQELLQRYTARILAMPEGARGQWLSWSPVVATAAGAVLVAATIGRSIRSAPVTPPPGEKLPDLPDTEWMS